MIKMRVLASHLALVFFLFTAIPCVSASENEMVVVFKGDKTEVPYEKNDGTITMRKPRAFRVPAFVGGVFNSKEFLVLLCDARYNGYSDWSFIEPAVKTSYGDYKKWSAAKIVSKNARANMTHSVLGDLTAVMKGNKIYVLAPSWEVSPTAWILHYEKYYEDYTGWDPLMIIGTVKSRTVSGGADEMYVEWEKGTSLKHLLPTTAFGKDSVQFIGGVGNGVVTKKGTIVFPIQIANQRSYYGASIMYSEDDGSTWKMGGLVGNYLSEGSVTEWGEGKLLLSTRYDYGFRLVFESDDMGATWKESVMFSRVWGNQQNRQGVGSQGSLITVPVNGKDVLLFAHPLNKLGGYKRDTLQLWMSDGQRIMSVGTISEDGKGERSGYSILRYVDDKLYIVHEINPFGEWTNYDAELEEWDRVIAISPIPHLLKRVKARVNTWKNVDTGLNAKSVPTNGLVGFLADKNKDAVWSDEYKSVNAYVNGGTKVTGGFIFDGKQGSGVFWPARTQGQNVFYIFTETQFTLAATVTIHSKSTSDAVPLLGASEDWEGNKLVIDLGYTKDNMWYVNDYYGLRKTTKISLEIGKEYHIAITYVNEEASVYVDGVSIMKWQIPSYAYTWIDHLYIGGIYKSLYNGCSCTVKNVMLFNRVLSKNEVNQIQNVDKQVPLQKPITSTEQTDTLQKPESQPTKGQTEVSENHESSSNKEQTKTSDTHTPTTTMGQADTSKNPEQTPTFEKAGTLDATKSTLTKGQSDTSKHPESIPKVEPTKQLETPTLPPTIVKTGKSEDPTLTSTIDKTKTLDDHTSTSTMDQATPLKHSKPKPNVEQDTTLKNDESTSKVKQTDKSKNSESTLQEEQTKTVEHPPSTPKVDTKETLVEPTSTPMSDTESTATLEDVDITPDILPKERFANPKSGPQINPKERETARWRTIPKNDGKVRSGKRISKTTTSTTENPKPADKSCDGDYCDIQNHSSGGDSQKGHKGVDGAVGSIYFTAWMCLVYSTILLSWL